MRTTLDVRACPSGGAYVSITTTSSSDEAARARVLAARPMVGALAHAFARRAVAAVRAVDDEDDGVP